MFSVTTKGASDIKSIVSAISTLAEEATFVANTDGMKFRTMDPAHVALIDMELPSEAFDKYNCDIEIKFGVRIADLSKILKRAKRDDDITITVTDKNMLLINIGTSKEFEMRLIESGMTETPLPNIEYVSKAIISIQKLSDALTDIAIFSEYFTVNTTPESIVFSGKGDSGKVSVSVDDLEDEIIGNGVVTHELKYLSDIINSFVEKNFNCTIELSDNKPAKYIFKIADVGVINFYMAPRVGGD